MLDLVPDGLGRDAEIPGDRLVGLSAYEHEENFQLAPGKPGSRLARSPPQAVAGGSDITCGSFLVEALVFGAPHGETC